MRMVPVGSHYACARKLALGRCYANRGASDAGRGSSGSATAGVATLAAGGRGWGLWTGAGVAGGGGCYRARGGWGGAAGPGGPLGVAG